jgi:hypothetical protein
VTRASDGPRRGFIQKNYDELKMLNPSMPFLVRDGWPGKDPYIVATYGKEGLRALWVAFVWSDPTALCSPDWGKEVEKTIGGLSEAQVEAAVRCRVKHQHNRALELTRHSLVLLSPQLKEIVDAGKTMPKFKDELLDVPAPIVNGLPKPAFE